MLGTVCQGDRVSNQRGDRAPSPLGNIVEQASLMLGQRDLRPQHDVILHHATPSITGWAVSAGSPGLSDRAPAPAVVAQSAPLSCLSVAIPVATQRQTLACCGTD